MMITKPGCVYCRQWRRDIGQGYSANPLGRQLALFETDIDGPYPDGLALARRPYVTPTFILLRDGAEMGRMEGYVGRDEFWPMLGQMVQGMPGS
ncbi:MAG: SoxS protein [Paracoccus denitrificans]|nr:MAG: SoxS protein [Paracoccus denitrificans]PZO85359.1 MAG: SoxS protein [Paracoccus denitrificans]